jgi:hypothetical protein
MLDLIHNLKFAEMEANGAQTADFQSSYVDVAGYDRCLVAVHIGAWTDGSFSFKLQDADDDGTGSPDAGTVADVNTDFVLFDPDPAVTVTDATNDGDYLLYEYRGGKRHVRVFGTVAGATTGATMQIEAILGDARHNPIVQG